MKALTVMLLVAVGGYLVYTYVINPAPSAAYTLYQEFATARAKGDYAVADKLVSGRAAATLGVRQASDNQNVGLNMPGARVKRAQMINKIAGHVRGVTFKLVEERIDGNDTHIQARASVCRELPNCMGARCTRCVPFNQTAKVCGPAGQMTICEFYEEREEVDAEQ